MTSAKRTSERAPAAAPERAEPRGWDPGRRAAAGTASARPGPPVAPDHSHELSRLAALLADRTRAAFCLALLDGRAWTAGELAAYARVAPSTASEHLSRLIDGGLLVERRQGRHRYVQLAGPRVAELLESVTAHLDPPATAPRGLRAATASAALARGRTCYDHLAGRLGVALTDAMAVRGLLDQDGGFALTDTGREWFEGALGIPSDALRAGRRPQARGCLDWTERRQHLAGTAGARLCERLLERRWIRRIGTGRAVRLTPEGTTALRELLGLDEEAAGLV
ncbi:MULTISPECIES: ArsR/SmtB family transcription factor [Streptomyces]|uniref:ArsR/SmtB family transcription factor n=1 Tax=Streptomyces TaxID=1883 RepID=UPI0019662514|nr:MULTISPECIES: winged helix-turn-helix domain-containing protein [Streptomyces]QRX92775.1 winged helix-turn-helix transcriptional regulator [Streptomyces noursei]UJB42494.1 winged helix-turn-helix transcriptional regulator [Streptomyces sp. A1-5]